MRLSILSQAEHPNPGQPYKGTSRVAYLPASPEGQELCRLLKKAFDARLVFTIDRSVTTGADNRVVWNNIHFKTSLNGGALVERLTLWSSTDDCDLSLSNYLTV